MNLATINCLQYSAAVIKKLAVCATCNSNTFDRYHSLPMIYIWIKIYLTKIVNNACKFGCVNIVCDLSV